MRDKVEWVEIMQRNPNETMFVNLVTGECTWDQPQNTNNIKRLHEQSDQWWELFNSKNSRYYYYNAYTLETQWAKPNGKDVTIIPLTKLQTLKENTSPKEIKDSSTQTSSLVYCCNASTQTGIAHERSIRHYLESQAIFAGICYNIDNYDHSDDEFDYFLGSSDENSTDNDADDEDNDEGEEDIESDELEDEDIPNQIHDFKNKISNDTIDGSDYFESSSFVYFKKSASFTSGLGQIENEKSKHDEGKSLDIRKERIHKEKIQEKEKRDDIQEEIKKTIEIIGGESKPIPPKRGISLDSSMVQNQNNGELEKYARENIKRHLKKGGLNQVFKRRQSLKGMLIWTKSSIKQPMIATLMNDNELKQEAINCFKLIQQYCGDRCKSKNSVKLGSIMKKEDVAKELIVKGVNRGLLLRDEIFVQLCRQTTDNPLEDSLALGLELVAVCLHYFAPSYKFAPYLLSFLTNHKSEFARNVCLKKLEKKIEGASLCGTSAGTYCRKPAGVDEIVMVINACRNGCTGIFGESLASLMATQSFAYPKRKLPWIQVTLSEAILRLGGAEQEGIFRIGGDVEEMTMIKLYIDCLQLENEVDTDFIELCNRWKGYTSNDEDVGIDVNTFACLLKQWFRELKEPLIPFNLYNEALEVCESPSNAINLVDKKLPLINKLVIGYLIRFLQVFSAKQNVDNTKMDENNLSMVWAPNILRAPTNNGLSIHSNPTLIFENTRKEMTFIRTLIQYLNTNYIQGVI